MRFQLSSGQISFEDNLRVADNTAGIAWWHESECCVMSMREFVQ